LTFSVNINLPVRVSVSLIMWWIVVGVAFVVLGYWMVRSNRYWLERGVNQERFVVPIFGDNWSLLFHKQSFADMIQEAYNKFPNSRQVLVC
jgi:hypothetical protein